MKDKTGGQAFPSTETYVNGDSSIDYIYHEGMTLRDYFAGQALAGMLASPNITISKVTDIAKEVYQMADAMINEREK